MLSMIKSAGAVRSHQTNELRRAAGMCSSKESDTANRLRKIQK